jgi:predicted branched-subunit amino acid permease
VTPPEEHLERPSSADDGRSRFRAGIRVGTAYGVAAGLVGITFGVVAEPVLGGVGTVVFSAIVFAGSAQFASTAVLGAGGGAPAAIVAGLFLNSATFRWESRSHHHCAAARCAERSSDRR